MEYVGIDLHKKESQIRRLSFAKTVSDSPGEDPWATGGLGTPDDRRADGPPLYRQAVGIASAIGPGQNDVIVRGDG